MNPQPAELKLKCSHCQTLVNVDKSGGLQSSNPVFKNFSCPVSHCKKQTYTVKCVCKNIITAQSSFFFGQKIFCPACQRLFNIVPCPICKQMNLWNGDYYMGAYINCFQCKGVNFQHVACPVCKEPNFWVTNKSIMSYYKCGLPVTCYVCKNKFQHLMCPHCKEAVYFKNLEYVQGIKQTCPYCSKRFQHVNCPGCGDPTFFKDDNFVFGQNYKCLECKSNFCSSICNKCGSSNSMVNKVIEMNTSFFDCSTCHNKYNLVCCPFCRAPNYPITEKGECGGNPCLYCKKSFKVLHCSLCNRICVCSCGASGKQHTCFYCKKIVIVEIQKGTGTAKTDEGEDKEKFLCKICYDKPVDTIFLKCKHVCACFSCAKSLKKKECPMCRLEGEFEKCFL